jgi:hypothetical protein
VPRIARHLFGLLVVALLALFVFHRPFDIVGPIIGLIFAGLIGFYGLAPEMIDRRTGESAMTRLRSQS